jgi:putative transposase
MKARRRVDSLLGRARRKRAQWLHEQANHYVRRFGVIKIEALAVQRMTRSAKGTVEAPGRNVKAKAKLNLAILSQGWSLFAHMLKYKAEEAGGTVLEVPAAYTSQTCSACGTVDAASRRTQSVFCCVVCGHTENADVNAAKNILSKDGVVVGGRGGVPTKTHRRLIRRARGTCVSTFSSSPYAQAAKITIREAGA